MTPTIERLHAIPTEYAQTKFRSRLEARWARFFDLVGWRWEYEPFDLAGSIPDFALIGVDQTALVEVKPVASLGDSIAKEAREKAERAVLASGRRDEIPTTGLHLAREGRRRRAGLAERLGLELGWRRARSCPVLGPCAVP